MSWQRELRNNVTTLDQLGTYSSLSSDERRHLKKVIDRHPMSVTRYYMSLIDWSDPEDPLRRMAIPSSHELDLSGSYDPSNETAVTVLPGVQHKYSPTALILTTDRCASYCRYCFRKRLVGLSTTEVLRSLDSAVEYVRRHEEINNVLLTGGDALLLSTERIERMLEVFSAIDHVDFVRFGSKIPAVFPDRILRDEKLLRVLGSYSSSRGRVYISTQFNHPRELTERSVEAIGKLLEQGVLLNNQSVLLKGVNDDPEVLSSLLNALVRRGVMPYYVFQCRPVKRANLRFQVPIQRGLEIMREARRKCSGLSKRFRYIMSHSTGKIEILGIRRNEIFFRYHEARDSRNNSRFFRRRVNPKACWLDEFRMPSSAPAV